MIAADMGMTARVSVRINPDVDAGTHAKISTGAAHNKFGIPIDDARRLYAFADAADAGSEDSALRSLITFLDESASSPVRRFTPAGWADDAVFDVRAILHALDVIYGAKRLTAELSGNGAR